MKNVSLAALALLSTLPAVAGADRDISKLSDEEKKKIAEKVAALQAPGPEHKFLAEMAGNYTTEIKVWPKPGAQPMVMHGKGTSRMILGGRFLQSESQSDIGETMMIFGFDRRREVYTVTECDTSGTYCIHAAGKLDEKTQEITLSGEDDDPTMAVTQKYDLVLKRVDPAQVVMSMVFKDPSHGNKEPFKMVEITRRKVP